MLGIGGKFVGAKGMALVPDLSGLTPPQADAAITAAGLTVGARSQSQTSNSSQNNKITSQGILANTLVDYETEISYQYLTYVEPPAPAQPPPVITNGVCDDNYDQDDFASACVGTKYVYPYSMLKYRGRVLVNGVWDGVTYHYNCDDVRVPEFAPESKEVPGECGVPVEQNCDPTLKEQTPGFHGECQSNNTYELTRRWSSDCLSIKDELRKTYPTCCYKAGTCTTFTSWSAYVNGESTRTQTCYTQKEPDEAGNKLCGSYTVTEKRCQKPCTAWRDGPCVAGSRTQTRTCYAADCDPYTVTQKVKCTGGAV